MLLKREKLGAENRYLTYLILIYNTIQDYECTMGNMVRLMFTLNIKVRKGNTGEQIAAVNWCIQQYKADDCQIANRRQNLDVWLSNTDIRRSKCLLHHHFSG